MRKFFVAILIAAAATVAACGSSGGGGTTPYWVGTKQFGTTVIDEAHGIAVDAAENAYATGWTRGGLDGNVNADPSDTTATTSDIFIVKYSSDGVKQ